MNKFLIATILLACLAAYAAAAVRPESKLYFSIPLGPAPAAAVAATTAASATTAAADSTATTAAADPTAATTTAASSSDATTAASGDSTTAAPAGPVLHIVPLIQAIGMLFSAVSNFLQSFFGGIFSG